jgi:ubiquinone/menaquinone biosynthesis C-methylase UbiE
MAKIIKFSKTYKNIISIKDDFYKNNVLNLKSQIKINQQYKKNPIRQLCKNCRKKRLHKFIENFSIEYLLCSNCSQLNGKYQDTSKFAKKLYSMEQGENYARNYLRNHTSRVRNIYIPKVNFLKSVIKKNIKLMDIGCGGGHFLRALEIKKINAIGHETSKVLCDLGNSKLKKNKIYNSNFKDIYKIVETNRNFNTISLIEVLEHLTDPHLLLKAFKKSHAKYLYISVPLFSLSVFLENSFDNIFQRQLSGGHTHLYTEKSLNFMAKKYNLKIIGEWWFGSDLPDLYRSLMNSGKILNKDIYIKEINKKLFSVLDDLQSVLDKKKICSEVHMIFKKK